MISRCEFLALASPASVFQAGSGSTPGVSTETGVRVANTYVHPATVDLTHQAKDPTDAIEKLERAV
jgi:hypothetical protein